MSIFVRGTYMENNNTEKDTKFLLLMVISMIFWGASWISAKLVAGYTSPQVTSFWRFFLTFISFIPVVIIVKEDLRISGKNLFFAFLTALFVAVYNQAFFTGLKAGLPGIGGVIVTTLNPLFTFGLSAIFFKGKFNKHQKIGLLIGLVGGIILLEVWQVSLDGLLKSGNIFFLAAALLWAFSTICSQRGQKEVSSFTFSFYVYAFTSVLTFIFAYSDEPFRVESFDFTFWANMVFLSIFAVSFATSMYFVASKRLGAGRAGAFTFLVPMTAAILSFFFFGEVPKITTIIGGVFALTAVYMINYTKKIPAKEPVAAGKK